MATVNGEPTTVSREGVSVVRTTDRKPDGVTAEFEVRTDRDSAILVEVVQEVLTGVPEEDIGFHPDREPDIWSIENSEVRFEATIAPDEQYITVLGVRTGGEAIDPLAGRPRILAAEPVDAGPDDVDSSPIGDMEDIDGEPFGDEGPFAADPDAFDTDAPPTVGDGGEGDTAAVGDTAQAGDEEDWVETTGDAVIAPAPIAEEEDDSDESAGDASASPEYDGSLAAALADELEAGTVDEPTRARLADALAPDDLSLRESDLVRIEHLQSRTEDFAAYAEVMEAFIDEHGSAQAFADEIRDDIEEFRADVSGEVAGLSDDVESIRADLDEAAESREEMRATLDDVADVTDDIEELHAAVEDLESLGDELDSLEEELEALREEQTDRIDELEAHITEFRQLRQGLQTAFGSDVAGSSDTDGGDDADD